MLALIGKKQKTKRLTITKTRNETNKEREKRGEEGRGGEGIFAVKE